MAKNKVNQPVPAPDASLEPAGNGSAQAILPGIEHIVVLMFENRSFDNVLGDLYPDKPQSDYNGLTGKETIPADPCSPSAAVQVFQGPTSVDTMIMPFPDPGELFNDMNEQIFGCCTQEQYDQGECPHPEAGPETMNGFVSNYGRQASSDDVKPIANNIMQYYNAQANGCIPITSALARNYAVSDQWFASGPVQTLANRFFVHCATPSTYVEQNKTFALKDNTELTKRHLDPDGSVDSKSIFQLLDEAAQLSASSSSKKHKPWKVYFHDWPLAAFVKYVDDNWGPLFGGSVHHIDDVITGFFRDLRRDELPTYSFIEPRYTDVFLGTPNSNHPGGSDIEGNGRAISICQGEKLLEKIYKAFHKHQKVFEKTLFIVVYDEHGGLYDHVPPPKAVSPFAPDTVTGFGFDRYGVRIPAIFINPFIRPGTVFRPPSGSAPFDHTSIISTLRAQFNLGGPLTPRDANAPTLKGLINPANPINLVSDLPSVKCKDSKTGTSGAAQKARPETIAAAIKQAILSPKNQARVSRLGVPKL